MSERHLSTLPGEKQQFWRDLPNSLFAFLKGDNSFHGVEPVTDPDTKRSLLLYNVYTEFPQVQPA
jgi:hypothetical protein